jgi:hypothetical protein
MKETIFLLGPLFLWLSTVVLGGAQVAAAETSPATPAVAEELRRIDVPEPAVGVAVDDEHVYAIHARAISKLKKDTGRVEIVWRAPKSQPHIRLSSGVVYDGKLHAALANVPAHPRANSVEIWDTATMRHVASHSLGIDDMTLAWIDRRGDDWWACFGPGPSEPSHAGPLRDVRWSSLVRFDDQWRRTGGWTLPAELLSRLPLEGLGGGLASGDTRFWCTAPGNADVHLLGLPNAGSALRLIATYRAPVAGPGLAVDPIERDVFYRVDAERQQIVAFRLPAAAATFLSGQPLRSRDGSTAESSTAR